MRPRRLRASKLATIAASLALAAAVTASAAPWPALAVTPHKGARYMGATVHGHVPLTFEVSSSGRTVTAAAPYAPLYCRGSAGSVRRLTSPAAVKADGSFRVLISYEYIPRRTITAQLVLQGVFTSSGARGVARSIFPHSQRCSGATPFSARMR